VLKKRKPTSRKLAKKAAVAPPARDTSQSAPRQTSTQAKAGQAKKPALRKRVPVGTPSADVTYERALLRGDLGDEEGPAREREQPEELIRGAAHDDLAEELGEEFVESATSGEQAAEDMRDEEVPEESGGPFVETSGNSEFAYGTDASNPKDAERDPFPTTRREK
jgi:hypothetical protein